MKRGQVTIFIIIGVVILSIFLMFLYVRSAKTEIDDSSVLYGAALDFSNLNKYTQDFFEEVCNDAVWEISFGGYLLEKRPKEDFTHYHGWRVPYYLTGASVVNYPSQEIIVNELKKHIIVEANALNYTTFENLGYEVTKEELVAGDIDISINVEEVSFDIDFPIKAKKGESSKEFKRYVVDVSIGLGRLFETAKEIAEDVQEGQTDISANCPNYDKNGLTNIYLRKSDEGTRNIVQLIDYGSYDERRQVPYRFHLALYEELQGECVG